MNAAALCSLLGLLISLSVTISFFTTPYMGLASFSYGLMCFGLYFRRRNRRVHRQLLGCAMALDLALVFVLEFQRSAIGTVVGLTLNPWQLAHVVFSVLAVLLYGPMIYFGYRLWGHNDPEIRLWHRRLGWLTFAFRSLGFLLMFSLLTRTT